MKATELIEQLQKIVDEHGDVPVYLEPDIQCTPMEMCFYQQSLQFYYARDGYEGNPVIVK